MSFSGKATYSADSDLPEIAEDVSDLVAINSPFETPLLDALGDPVRMARSTVHEWLEDALLANVSAISDSSISNGLTDTTFVVASSAVFRVGDQIQIDGKSEVMLVTAIDSDQDEITVVRGYGGSTAQAVVNAAVVRILGNAALEGDSAATARFTSRVRCTNYTQIFTSTVEISGSELAVRKVGVTDELDYQKQQRTRELLRDLENVVINGRAPVANPAGTSSVRRTMRGILASIQTHAFTPGSGGFPSGTTLSETQLNTALKNIWTEGNGRVDLIVVNGAQKRRINAFISPDRRYFGANDEAFKNAVSVYESDFGVCRVVMSRWVPNDAVLLLDSSRVDVLPLAGRSFQYKPLAITGDRTAGQVLGEYTLEFRNENAHGVVRGLV